MRFEARIYINETFQDDAPAWKVAFDSENYHAEKIVSSDPDAARFVAQCVNEILTR